MFNVLDQNKTHVLEMEKIQGKWWVTLIERKTGLAQTLICDTRLIAYNTFKDMELAQVVKAMTRWKVKAEAMYKPNYKTTRGV